MKGAVEIGHHPTVRMRMTTSVIMKHANKDLENLKSYEMMSALRCTRKILDEVVVELQSDECRRSAQLCDGQFGIRKTSLASDAAAIMVDRAYSAWKDNIITGILLMHIKAACPSVERGRLICTIKAKQIDGDLIKWIESFLSDKAVEIAIDGNVSQSCALEAGVPLGCTVSPILFAINTAGLIMWDEESIQRLKGLS